MSFTNNFEIPEPAIKLGTVGQTEWTAIISDYGDWLPHELRTLNLACIALDQAANIAEQLNDETDFKKVRQLRADLNAAGNEHRRQMRELSLSTRPADSRPARIAGRY